MALSRPQARILGALMQLGPTSSMTAEELSPQTSMPIRTVRDALRGLDRAGMTIRSSRTPAEWRITPTGRVVAGRPVYREETSRHPSG